MQGKFITVEGVEGVGKSTNIATIQGFLDSKNINYISTREPGGTLIAEKIRQILLAVEEEPICELSELLLVFAARAQHLETLIKPALDKGVWVLCDRFTDATYAYQGAGRGLSSELIATLESLAQKELRPNLTIMLDLDPEVGLARAKTRGELDRFEKEAMEFFNKVRDCYLEIAEMEPDRCKILDAGLPIEQVKGNLLKLLEQQFSESDW